MICSITMLNDLTTTSKLRNHARIIGCIFLPIVTVGNGSDSLHRSLDKVVGHPNIDKSELEPPKRELFKLQCSISAQVVQSIICHMSNS